MQGSGAATYRNRVPRADALRQRSFEQLNLRPLGEELAIERPHHGIDVAAIDALASIAEKPRRHPLLDCGSELSESTNGCCCRSHIRSPSPPDGLLRRRNCDARPSSRDEWRVKSRKTKRIPRYAARRRR